MWIVKDGKLVHSTDTSRENFRTTIYKAIISELDYLSSKYNTHSNYLLETGFVKFLETREIDYNKMPRVNPKDRVLFSTTYDRELLQEIKDVAEQNFLHVNQLIEYCFQLIDVDGAKDASYRYRIERE